MRAIDPAILANGLNSAPAITEAPQDDYGDVPPTYGQNTTLPSNITYNPDGSLAPGIFGMPQVIGGIQTKHILIGVAAILLLAIITKR